MTDKEKYLNFCNEASDIPIFSQYWWMDAVCESGDWNVLLVENGDEIVATLPYFTKRKFLFSYITQPLLTQNNGLYIKYPNGQKYSNKLSYEKKIMCEIIDKLEGLKLFYYNQNFHYSFENWLPFYWRGFCQTTRYTYVIDKILNIEEVYNNFDHAKRKNIKKANKIVEIRFDMSPSDFYANHKMTLAKQKQSISYSYELFERIYRASYERSCGKTIFAVDENNNVHGALFVVWDNESAYDLISTFDPDFRNSGASSLLVFEIIKYLKDKVDKFDFEGSMIENVENSFRQFGAKQKPYFNIRKSYSAFAKVLSLFKNR